jgi:hypothetical protein
MIIATFTLTLPTRLLKITRELFEQKGFDERNEFISVSQVQVVLPFVHDVKPAKVI